MLTIRQLFLSFFLLGLFILKSQAVGSSTYLDVHYGEEEYTVCPVDDGWNNSYWAKLEMAQGSLSNGVSISGDPYYEFDELCPKDTFTTCGCLYREFAKELMISLNERSVRMSGKEVLPSANTGYENYKLLADVVVEKLFANMEEYFSFLTEIEDKLNIYIEKDLCDDPKNKEVDVCGKDDTLGLNAVAHAKMLHVGTYLFGIHNYETTDLSFGGPIPAASLMQFSHDFKRMERDGCRVIFSEAQRREKQEVMYLFFLENDAPEMNGSVFCPFVNGRRTLLSYIPVMHMITKEICPSRVREIN